MNSEKKLMWLYGALLVLLGMFFAALFFFVTSARELHSEGVLRRPPKHGPRGERPRGIVPPPPAIPAMIEVQASTTPER